MERMEHVLLRSYCSGSNYCPLAEDTYETIHGDSFAKSVMFVRYLSIMLKIDWFALVSCGWCVKLRHDALAHGQYGHRVHEAGTRQL